MNRTTLSARLRGLTAPTLLVLAAGLSSCDQPETVPASPQGALEEELGSQDLPGRVDVHAPYAGEWAERSSDCDEERKLWTIEPRRMAIVPSMRFCLFEKIYVNAAAREGETVWSAASQCLAEGRESQDFLFFRLKDNLREMRVTFNDSHSVDLVRCQRS